MFPNAVDCAVRPEMAVFIAPSKDIGRLLRRERRDGRGPFAVVSSRKRARGNGRRTRSTVWQPTGRYLGQAAKTWMAATSAAMTQGAATSAATTHGAATRVGHEAWGTGVAPTRR